MSTIPRHCQLSLLFKVFEGLILYLMGYLSPPIIEVIGPLICFVCIYLQETSEQAAIQQAKRRQIAAKRQKMVAQSQQAAANVVYQTAHGKFV